MEARTITSSQVPYGHCTVCQNTVHLVHVVDLMKLMLLGAFRCLAAPGIIALPPKVAMILAGVDATFFLLSALNVNVKVFQ